MPRVRQVDRATFQVVLDEVRDRQKAHTRDGDAIGAARRLLPVVEVDAPLPLTGPEGSRRRAVPGSHGSGLEGTRPGSPPGPRLAPCT